MNERSTTRSPAWYSWRFGVRRGFWNLEEGRSVCLYSGFSPDSTGAQNVLLLRRRFTLEENESAMQYSIPVILAYDGGKRLVNMGPFERSLEREFSLSVQKKAIEDCDSLGQLKEVSMSLLQGWSNMQEAVQTLVMENIQLRQAMSLRDDEIRAAEALMEEAANQIEKQQKQQSSQSKRNLWPWSK